MSKLQIGDLDFCETANDSQIQGGLSVKTLLGVDLSSLLTDFLPKKELENYSSEDTGEYEVKEFKDESGDNYAFQATSIDGKKQVTGSIGRINNLNYATSSVRIST
jgi:hypothetical protein